MTEPSTNATLATLASPVSGPDQPTGHPPAEHHLPVRFGLFGPILAGHGPHDRTRMTPKANRLRTTSGHPLLRSRP